MIDEMNYCLTQLLSKSLIIKVTLNDNLTLLDPRNGQKLKEIFVHEDATFFKNESTLWICWLAGRTLMRPIWCRHARQISVVHKLSLLSTRNASLGIHMQMMKKRMTRVTSRLTGNTTEQSKTMIHCLRHNICLDFPTITAFKLLFNPFLRLTLQKLF